MPSGDFAVRAFRKFARICPDADRLGYFKLSDRLRGICRTDAEAFRMLAVYDTLRLLEAEGREESVKAVRAVYFVSGGRTPRKNDISFRVRRFAIAENLDERTVWRRLGEAKTLYLRLTARG